MNATWLPNAPPAQPPPYLLASDFLFNSNGPLTEITIWGSWWQNRLPGNNLSNVIFTLSIHSDIPDPDGPGPLYSQPGPMLWQWTFFPGQFAGRLVTNVPIGEGWLTPPNQYQFPGDSRVYEYDFKINPTEAFTQTNGNIYWLDVQARPQTTQTNVLFGWKTSITNWNDDSVWAKAIEPWPGPWQELRRRWQPPNYPSIDLAFRLAAEQMGGH